MRRSAIRRLSRRISTSLTVLLLLTIFGPTLAEFFVEFGKERGWYDKPSARIEAAMTALTDLVTQTWVLMLASLLVGLTCGLWLDAVLRRWSAQSEPDEIPAPPRLGPPGSLDLILGSAKAIDEIRDAYESANKDIHHLAAVMKRYKWRLLFVRDGNYVKRHKIAAHVAAKINAFSDRFRSMGGRVANAAERVYANWSALIDGSPITTHDDLNAIMGAERMIGLMLENSTLGINAVQDARVNLAALYGHSAELNGAIDHFGSATADFAREIVQYEKHLSNLHGRIQNIIADAESALAGQAAPPSPPQP